MRALAAVTTGGTLAVLALLLLSSCSGDRSDTLDDLVEMESTQGYEGREVPDSRVAELREAIKRYSAVVEEKIEAGNQLGVYYKMLGQEYLDQGMYQLSLEAFEEATRIHPENAVLYYRAGLSAAQYAGSRVDPVDRDRYVRLAESYYKTGLEIEPTNPDLLYGLSILYVFELDMPDEALPLSEVLLDREPRNVSALFVAGRAYAALGRTESAIEAYERAAEAAPSDDVRSRALKNARDLLGGRR